MSSIQRWFGSVPALSLIFAGGRAPVSWQRELARHIAKLNDLSQACQWVNDSANIDLRLQDSPLLGHYLADLTAQPAPTKPAPETVQVPHRRFTWTKPLQKQQQKPDFPDDRPSKRSQIEFPGKPTPTKPIPQEVRKLRSPSSVSLESQASQALLHRLAGETGSIANLSLTQRSHSQLISLAKQGALSAPQVSVTHQDWLERLTHRVRHTLNPDTFERLNRFYLPSSISLHQPERSQGLGLVEQWAMPLNGRSAPPELLHHLANLPTKTRLSAPEAEVQAATNQTLGQQTSRGASTSETEQHQPMSQYTTASGWLARLAHAPLNTNNGFPQKGTPPGSPQHRLTTQDTPLTAPSFTDGTQSQLTQNLVPSDRENGVRDVREVSIEPATSAQIAPPVVSVPLPQLHPPQTVNMPAPTIAAFTARQGAKQEETATTEDDLNKLAAQIKRILDEEARRYGIDV